MDNLELKKDLIINLAKYMGARGLAYRTKLEYVNALKLLQKNNKFIDQKLVNNLLAKSSSSRNRAVFSLINNYCLDNEISFSIKIPRTKTKARSHPEVFSKEEIKIIIDSVPKPYNLMLRIIYSGGAGLRISEAISLTFGRFNWGVWISEMKGDPSKQPGGVLRIKEGKGGKDRLVNIPYSLMESILDYARRLEVLDERGIPNSQLRLFKFGYEDFEEFLNKTDQIDRVKIKTEYVRVSYDWFKNHILKKYCFKALGRRFKIHSFRHSRATHLLEEGVPIEKIQKLLGHASIQTTMIYSQISEKETLRSMEGIKEI